MSCIKCLSLNLAATNYKMSLRNDKKCFFVKFLSLKLGCILYTNNYNSSLVYKIICELYVYKNKKLSRFWQVVGAPKLHYPSLTLNH